MDELSVDLESSSFKLQYSKGVDYGAIDSSAKCHVHHLNTAITADGRVAYCKSLRDVERWSLGNVNTLSLKEIFDGDLHAGLRTSVTPTNCGILPCPLKEANLLINRVVSTGDMSALGLPMGQIDFKDFI